MTRAAPPARPAVEEEDRSPSSAAFLKTAAAFHGHPAPGLLMGARMVAEAQERLPAGILYEAICETRWCLPDAIQLLTPCTTGNGRLAVLDWGRYALSLFDKFSGHGVRVYLDPAKLSPFDAVLDWFLKRRPRHAQDSARLGEQILRNGAHMLSAVAVQVRPALLGKPRKGAIAVCPACAEAYPARHGPVCRGCRATSPYLDPAGDAVARPARMVSVRGEKQPPPTG